MQTIKTGVVIVLLVAVCYGAFIALNAPEADIPEELQEWANAAEIDGLMAIEMPSSDSSFGVDLSGAQPVPSGDQQAAKDPATANVPSLPQLDFGGDSADLPVFPAIPATQAISSNQQNIPLPPSVPLASPPSASAAPEGRSVPVITAEAPLNDKNAGSLVGHSQPAPEGSSAAWDPNASPQLPVTKLGGPHTLDVPPPKSTAVGQTTAPAIPFEIAREQALLKAKSGQLKEALQMLSPYYLTPELGYAEHSDLVDILDALSREVIYSNRSLMEPAYTVGGNETVTSVAEKHKISPELLASINSLGEAKALTPGTKIKVLQGPFRAKVTLNRGELTIFLGNLYAGRFPISVGHDAPGEGVFEITDRRLDRTYYGPGNRVIPANEPNNPYGNYWLGMGGNLAIHSSPEMADTDLEKAGCISLAPLDAADVYKILTVQCQVEIVR